MIRKPDRVKNMDGAKKLPGANASTLAGGVFGPLVRSQSTLPFVVERDTKQKQLSIPVTRACAFGVELQ